MALYLGIDIGTSRLKATVLNEEGEVVQTLDEKIKVCNPKPGFFEIEPIKVWWRSFLRVLGKLSSTEALKKIESICVSSVCGTFVPVNEKLEPVYNAILYGIDTRAMEQVKRLNELFGESCLIHKLGSKFTTHSVIPKILWLKENLPEVYASARYFLQSTNFITSRLTSRVAWDVPTASGCQLIDLQTVSYCTDLFDHIGLDPQKLPILMWPYQELGKVSKSASRITGLNEGTRVFVGACDINMDAIACGAISPGDLVLVFGSTTSFLLTIDKLLFREGFSTSISVIPNTYKLGGATSSGARFINLMKRLLRPVRKTLNGVNIPTGLIILPYLDGARCPYHDPNAVGVIYGLRSDCDLKTLHVGLIEALAIEAGVIVNRLADLIPEGKAIHVTGGLTKDLLLISLLASTLNRPIAVHHDTDASYGCALLALRMSKNSEGSVSSVKTHSEVVYPDGTLASKYAELIKKYELIYGRIIGI